MNLVIGVVAVTIVRHIACWRRARAVLDRVVRVSVGVAIEVSVVGIGRQAVIDSSVAIVVDPVADLGCVRVDRRVAVVAVAVALGVVVDIVIDSHRVVQPGIEGNRAEYTVSGSGAGSRWAAGRSPPVVLSVEGAGRGVAHTLRVGGDVVLVHPVLRCRAHVVDQHAGGVELEVVAGQVGIDRRAQIPRLLEDTDAGAGRIGDVVVLDASADGIATLGHAGAGFLARDTDGVSLLAGADHAVMDPGVVGHLDEHAEGQRAPVPCRGRGGADGAVADIGAAGQPDREAASTVIDFDVVEGVVVGAGPWAAFASRASVDEDPLSRAMTADVGSFRIADHTVDRQVAEAVAVGVAVDPHLGHAVLLETDVGEGGVVHVLQVETDFLTAVLAADRAFSCRADRQLLERDPCHITDPERRQMGTTGLDTADLRRRTARTTRESLDVEDLAHGDVFLVFACSDEQQVARDGVVDPVLDLLAAGRNGFGPAEVHRPLDQHGCDVTSDEVRRVERPADRIAAAAAPAGRPVGGTPPVVTGVQRAVTGVVHRRGIAGEVVLVERRRASTGGLDGQRAAGLPDPLVVQQTESRRTAAENQARVVVLDAITEEVAAVDVVENDPSPVIARAGRDVVVDSVAFDANVGAIVDFDARDAVGAGRSAVVLDPVADDHDGLVGAARGGGLDTHSRAFVVADEADFHLEFAIASGEQDSGA